MTAEQITATAQQLKSLTDKLFVTRQLTSLSPTDREDMLQQVATTLYVLRRCGYRVCFHPDFIHIFPLNHVETLAYKVSGKDVLKLVGSRSVEDVLAGTIRYLDQRITYYTIHNMPYKREMYERSKRLILEVTSTPIQPVVVEAKQEALANAAAA